MGNPIICDIDNTQRFGVEIELNSSDRRDFKDDHPLDVTTRELPKGVDYIGCKLLEISQIKQINITRWHHTHNNDIWVIKPDSSCGIEVCSPILKGMHGINEISRVAYYFGKDEKILIDDRCSMHVHFDVSKFTQNQLRAVAAWWVKCEMVILSLFSDARKRSRYCMQIGLTDIFQHDDEISLTKLGIHKYLSMNMFHLVKGNRKTIEFRVADQEACVDAIVARNWLKLLFQIVKIARLTGPPLPYDGRPMTGLSWLDPGDVFKFLFSDYDLSKDLEETKFWFVQRLEKFTPTALPGMWNVRDHVLKEVEQIAAELK